MRAYADIQAVGLRGAQTVTAVVDTGFDGELCLPIEIAVGLGLELVGTEFVEYADGRIERELLFRGSVQFLGETKTIRIALTESEDALLGMALLKGRTLLIDCDTGGVRIERKPASADAQ
jgi:clan AA aspartic protease